ncbi:hypothetical protein PYW07_010722 [Mythimna separata]|uniref:beta-N-acetylhexosaminidase n=1 Tax=Mythimna separata TaxID=271217 RepID=A0AAD8DKD0_MYTSE|nr:hypothetical protein PYW07_010722 [Mythimna separata]
MLGNEAFGLSGLDCKKEKIEKRWTNLLLNWLNKCIHPAAPVKELNPWSTAAVLDKYRQDLCVDEIDGAILCSDIESFVRYKYPILRLRYYDVREVHKKMYLMTSIILFHCCVSSLNGMVDSDICINLTKTEQEMILKFCEQLSAMEVTCNNIELAIKDACDSVKQDSKTYRQITEGHKLSNVVSDPSECTLTPEMPLSSLNSMTLKETSGDSWTMSSFTSMATSAAFAEKSNTMFQSIDFFDTDTLTGIPPLNSKMVVGKSPTGSLKITTTFKSVEYESYMPCSSTDRPPYNAKTLCKSPTGSMKQTINATYKTVEYESFVPGSAPDRTNNPKALEKSPKGIIKPNLAQTTKNRFESFESCSSGYCGMKGVSKSPTGSLKFRMNPKSKAKNKYESFESCSSVERPSDCSKVLDKSRSRSLERDLNVKSKAKYKPFTSPDRSPSTSKAANKTTTENRKDNNAKSKASKHKSNPPVISIMTAGKPPTDERFNSIQFKSSVTVLPSVVTTDASYSDVDYGVNDGSKSDMEDKSPFMAISKGKLNFVQFAGNVTMVESAELGSERRCLPDCSCSRCSPNGPCCADPGITAYNCDVNECTAMDSCSDECNYIPPTGQPVEPIKAKNGPFSYKKLLFNKKVLILLTGLILLINGIAFLIYMLTSRGSPVITLSIESKPVEKLSASQEASFHRIFQLNSYICKEGLCQKVYEPTSEYIYSSLSRCVLLCTGPQLWPHPIGYTYYSKKVVVLATNKLEYKFQSVPSQAVHMYLAEAFKLFLGDLAKLERYTLDARRMNISKDAMIKKMYIQMDVETDPDPRIKLGTDESYTVKVETMTNQVVIKLVSASFCGLRHALETLSQLILLDQSTGNLITLSNIIIKDAPSYKYRGLMIDTGRNYIPIPDIMRTIDAMATVKLNTFHWRISGVTSFPLYLPAVPQLFEYGAYDRKLVYTKDAIKAVVRRAGIRGIRILLEVAAPGPVGRAWSWIPEATCPTKNENFTCNNVLCLRLGMHYTVFDILQIIYSEILEMTKLDDVFHLSDGMFSLVNCFNLLESRDGFLDKALERLKLANKGFLPKLPIIWYTAHLTKDLEARTWDRFGVQLTEWQPNPSEQSLSRFKAIHSSRWDLSCEVKKQRCIKYRTWQEMYSWKSWRNLEVFTIEGGEAILWTDLVDTGNLDYHLWPRAAAVAERLWSDVTINATVTSHVYVRLDSQRWRMVLKSIQVQPIWPLYCSFSPGVCLQKIKAKNCNICLDKSKRYHVHDLPLRFISKLGEWISPVTIAEEDYICKSCYELLTKSIMNELTTSDDVPQTAELSRLGHRQVCCLCGRSLLQRQSHSTVFDNPSEEQTRICAVIETEMAPCQMSLSDRICHPCWLRCKRTVVRIRQADEARSTSTTQEDGTALRSKNHIQY